MFLPEISIRHTYKTLARNFAVGLVSAILGGCAIDIQTLSSCPTSGIVHFDSIPIASKSEHEQSLHFEPSDHTNCLVYVIRGHDYWTGKSLRRTLVILTPKELDQLKIPADPTELSSMFGDQILEIHDHVYAMWELPPASYILSAFFRNNYFSVFYPVETWNPTVSPMAQVELECKPGEVQFFTVDDRGFGHNVVLNNLNVETGREYVRNSLRSVGCYDSKNPGFRNCQEKW